MIVAAHNEERVIGRCLDALAADARGGELEVIVAANGCTDDTVAVSSARPGVRVLDLPLPGKAAALNAAERYATGFPRVYLDADIVLDTTALRALADAVRPGGALAAAAQRQVVVDGRPWPVRAYFAVNRRLPAYGAALFGRGAIALSAEARGRFGEFPDLLADDLFLDSLFATGEKAEVTRAVSRVEAPWTTRHLVRRLVRVRRANEQFRVWQRAARTVPAATPRPSRRLAWLTEVVLRRPSLLPAGVAYGTITVLSELAARRDPAASTWGRDDTTRVAAVAP